MKLRIGIAMGIRVDNSICQNLMRANRPVKARDPRRTVRGVQLS
jgi:hypothetical protein